MEDSNIKEIQFKWGVKRGVGGAKKDVQFYESFTLDGVTYNLYDCVYLFKKGESEPFIGKILKLWEHADGKRKAKILWFFLPIEILPYLGEHKVLEKEIFLASGEGVGLTNINPLEAIADKCSVICTSKDFRNPQASRDAIEKAHFIFYRTFDVGKLTICDTFPDKIAGIEVPFLLNQEEDRVTNSFIKDEKNGFDTNGKAEAGEASGSMADEKINLAKHKAESDISESKPLKKKKLSGNSVKSSESLQKTKSVTGAKNDSDASSIPLSKEISEKAKLSEKKVETQKTDSVTGAKKDDESSIPLNKENSEKAKLSEQKVKPQKTDNVTGAKKDDSDESSIPSKKKLIDKRVKLSDEPLKKLPSVSLKKKTEDVSLQKVLPVSVKKNEADRQIVEVTRRPDAERSKWFKGLPWEDRLKKANEQGTLVFLENFDRSLTSTDIEDIMYHTFKQSCTAKVIPCLPPYHNPHHGQAYTIFRTADAADDAIRRINKGCLVQQNGSAFIASKGMLPKPQKATKHPGHLIIRTKRLQQEEWRKAVYTSHCSQPNTIEYEMAMDWILMQEKTVNSFNRLDMVMQYNKSGRI